MFKKLDKFNSHIIKEGFEPFSIGIGINKGKAVSGNIGSEQQMNYTVIGDTINLGARLCSHAKSGEILISNSVKDHISKIHNFKKISPIHVKGKAKPIEVWLYTHKKNKLVLKFFADYYCNIIWIMDSIHPPIRQFN